MRYQLIALVSMIALALAACGSDDECAGHTHEPKCLVCSQSDHDSFTSGTVKVGNDGNLKLEIVSADPSPHQEGNNTMVVKVMDASDQPLTGVTFDVVETYYPPGQHGTPIVPEITENGAGEYSITQINYVHEGIWTLTMELTAGSMTDTLFFEFCVEALAP